MAVDEKTTQALDLKKLKLPQYPVIERIEAKPYTDSAGEPSLRILVVLDEATDISKVSGEAVGELKAAIRESLQEHGSNVFPYIFLAKPSELDDSDDEE